VVVFEGRVEKLRAAMEVETWTKAMMVGHAKGEMPPDMRVMLIEPTVKSVATAEREFTSSEGWRRSQHHHQECDEHQPAISHHDPPLQT
jgi:hypothetical protein